MLPPTGGLGANLYAGIPFREGNEDIATRFDADVSPEGDERPCIRIVRVFVGCAGSVQSPKSVEIGQTTNLTKTCLQFNRK